MSSKQPKDDTGHPFQLTPRCLVLILKSKRERRSCANGLSIPPRPQCVSQDQSPVGWRGPACTGPGGPQTGNPAPGSPATQPGEDPALGSTAGGGGGKAIFESFQKENSGCYWNPHLEESIKNLKYMGLIQPNSLLVCGRDIYLDTIKNAFARKVLVPPTGFSVHKVGDVETVAARPVQQTQFTPLPEALCVVIHELQCEATPATLDTVRARLAARYRRLQPPPEDIVYETLGSLMKERKIYHTGSTGTGYFIVTPDTYKNGCFNQAHLGGGPQASPGPTVYVPLLTPISAEMRSISCQTETDKLAEAEKGQKEDKKKGKLERSQSLNRGKNNKEKKSESLNRTMSLKYGEEKGKKIVKDINLRTSEAHQDKDKGEKTSLFNKIFGRGKSRRSVAVEEDLEEEPEVEYATFCAQFPPPEWAWYEAQVPPMAVPGKRSLTSPATVTSPPGVMTHMAHVHNWNYMQGVPHFDAGTQSDFDDEDYLKPLAQPNHMTKHVTSTPHMTTTNALPGHMSSSHSHESHSSSYDAVPSPRASRHQERGRSRHHRPLSKPHHGLRYTPPTPMETSPTTVMANQNEYVQYGDDDERHIYCEPSNPMEMYSRNIQYEDAILSQGVHDRLVPPVTDHIGSNSLPSKNVNGHALNNNGFKTELFPQSNSKSLPMRYKSGQRKYRDLTCPGFCGNDISIEYRARMPKRNSTFSLSRDSGVNCVGVKDCSNSNFQSGKDSGKKLALLNNQTGVSSSSRVTTTSSPSGGLSLNNQIPMSRADSLPTEVHPHRPHHRSGNTTAEYNVISHSHQDSGFSSPRTDADHANYSSIDHQNPSLPLNNISIDANNRRSAGHINAQRPMSRSLSRDGGRHGKDSNRISMGGLHGISLYGESGKENRACHPAFKSLESIHITSSEKYPSCAQLHVEDCKDTATVDSSRSGSSKTTVVGVGENVLDGGAHDADTSRTSDATYMEIQLVTSDCPVHGDVTPAHDAAVNVMMPRDGQRVHRMKDTDLVVNKRHSIAGKSTRHYSGQWSQSRHTGSHGHHYGNINSGNNNNDKEGKSSNPASNPRLAFLGKCEVVGIL